MFSNLGAGTYTVVVSGQYGFTISSNVVNLVNPTALQVSTAVDTNFVTVTASGGTGALSYSIDGVNFQPENTFADLGNGVYTITILDANGCTATAQAIVAVNTLLASLEIQSQLLCNGGNQGTIIVHVGGGQPPFHYSLNGGIMQTSNVFQNLPAGAYIVKITDNQGFNIFSNTVQIINPPAIFVAANATLNVVTVVASGGTGALEYSLNGVDFQSGNTFTGLTNGNYTVTVRDANGCSATTDVAVGVAALAGVAILTSDLPCSGALTATIEVTSSGGIPPYEYRLDNGIYQSGSSFSGLGAGTYTITVRDATGTELSVGPVSIAELDLVIPTVVVTGNDAIVSFTGGGGGPYHYTLNGAPNAPLTDLPNGEYILLATDEAAGCTGETAFTVALAPLSATFAVYDIEPCDELINLVISPSGGTPPFEYALDNSSYSQDSVFENVGSGMHTVHVRDAQGQLFSLPIDFTLPQVVSLTAEVLGDSIVAMASAGLGPYQYSLDGINFQSSSVFANLPPGIYVVTVRDAGGCTASVENILIVTGAPEPAL
ncbi:MAG: SprB repeat-containing protein, partial [Saprospiraceae bacterium]